MIATINGKITEKIGDLLVIEASGVGYGLNVTIEDFGSVSLGDQTKFYIYDHIRENSHDLFGFAKLETKNLFEQLLSVNGVGPKMALSILNVGNSKDVRAAIATGNTALISKASGVGKRLAERVVVDLKDKVGLVASDLSGTDILTSSNYIVSDEATQALMSLGYNQNDAVGALKDIDESLPVEQRIKLALKGSKR
ncbi:MAG: Holliday junction branch migration protein RuvA [bacterium]|jgi:Holliday junction DNA helicase RuvA